MDKLSPFQQFKNQMEELKKLIHFCKIYIPYDVLISDGESTPIQLTVNNFNTQVDNNGKKLLLRPLSDLSKEIEHNDERFVPMTKLSVLFEMNVIEHCFIEQNFQPKYIKTFRYEVVQQLLEWHFDLFGLIDQELAIDINKINK